jgi:hypothetical protein
MKVRAAILLMCVAVYITETSSIGYSNCGIVTNIQETVDKPDCCSGEKSCAMQQAAKKQSPQKENAGNCGKEASCTNCPICYTAIFPVTALLTNPAFSYKQQYPVIQINYNSTYSCESWKPPNECLLHTT